MLASFIWLHVASLLQIHWWHIQCVFNLCEFPVVVILEQGTSVYDTMHGFIQDFCRQNFYRRSRNFRCWKFFIDDLFRRKLNTRNILCNVHWPIPILVTKVWRRKLDYAKNLQAKYFIAENILIYSISQNVYMEDMVTFIALVKFYFAKCYCNAKG